MSYDFVIVYLVMLLYLHTYKALQYALSYI